MRTKQADIPQASTKAPQKQARPHAPRVQPFYNPGENESDVPVARGETAV